MRKLCKCVKFHIMSDETKSLRLQMVIAPSQVATIDAWRKQQDSLPSRSEAIRSLVERGLNADAYVDLLDKSLSIIADLAREEDRTPELAVRVIEILGGYKSRVARTKEFDAKMRELAGELGD